MLGLPLLIIGLVLLLAGSSWFTGAATVGVILTVAGGIVCLLSVLFVFGIIGAAARRR